MEERCCQYGLRRDSVPEPCGDGWEAAAANSSCATECAYIYIYIYLFIYLELGRLFHENAGTSEMEQAAPTSAEEPTLNLQKLPLGVEARAWGVCKLWF